MTSQFRQRQALFLWDLFSQDFRKRNQKSTYLLWLSQALTTPVEAPSCSEARRLPKVTSWPPAQEGGGFYERSQRLTTSKKYVCWINHFISWLADDVIIELMIWWTHQFIDSLVDLIDELIYSSLDELTIAVDSLRYNRRISQTWPP